MPDNKLKRRWHATRFVCRKRDDGSAEIDGHAIVYNQEIDCFGWYREIIAPGALDDADLTDVLFFVNHDTNKIPLARSRHNNENSTLQLSIDDIGLFFEASLDVDANTESSMLYSAVYRGDITGMSFGFFVDAEEWEGLDDDDKIPLCRITKISEVIEISAVNWPAYDETEINLRSQNAQAALDSARSSLDSEGAKAALDSARRSLDSEMDNSLLLAQKAKFGFIGRGL